MSDPVTIGLLGWGNFSSHIHEETVRDLVAAGKVRLKGICVRTPATREAIMERLPAEYGTADYHEILADEEIQAVIIGAPHAVQARMAIDALKAGKYVYVEKPTFAEEEDTGAPARAFYDEFVALGQPALDRLAVGLNKRFAPAYRELRDLCRDEWGGAKVLQFTVTDDAWRWNAGRYPEGFLLWLDIAHWLDLARWFTGAEVASLSAIEPQPEDSQVTLQMTDGTLVSIFLGGNVTMDVMKEEFRVCTTSKRSARAIDYIEMELFGGPEVEVRRYAANQQSGGDVAYTQRINEGGLAAFKEIRREVFEYFEASRGDDPEGDARVRRNIPNFMRPQGWRESLWEFVETVAAGGVLTNNATYRDAYVSYELLEMIRKSIANGGQFVPAKTVANG